MHTIHNTQYTMHSGHTVGRIIVQRWLVTWLECGMYCIEKDVTRQRNRAAIKNYNIYGIL